jgi:hypothetical protein
VLKRVLYVIDTAEEPISARPSLRGGMEGASALHGRFMRKVLGLSISAAAILATGLLPVAAFAATTGPAAFNSGASFASTPVTFTVDGTGIGLTEPGSVDFGSEAIGGTVTGSLGEVQVADDQGLDGGGWTATAASSDFTTGAGPDFTSAETIPNSAVGYDPGDVTASDTITATPHTIDSLTGTSDVVVGTDAAGDNTASWDPTITIAVPSTAVAGAYSGTITDSVS